MGPPPVEVLSALDVDVPTSSQRLQAYFPSEDRLKAAKPRVAEYALKSVLYKHRSFASIEDPYLAHMFAVAVGLSATSVRKILPCEKHLREGVLDRVFLQYRTKMQEHIGDGPISLIVDEWTSSGTRHTFLGVCAQFYSSGVRMTIPIGFKALTADLMNAVRSTSDDSAEYDTTYLSANAENLAKVVKLCVTEFGIDWVQVVALSSDTTALMPRMTKRFLELPWHPCLSHRIQRIVGDVLKAVQADSELDPALVQTDLVSSRDTAVLEMGGVGEDTDDEDVEKEDGFSEVASLSSSEWPTLSDTVASDDLASAPLVGSTDAISKLRRLVSFISRSSKAKRTMRHFINKKNIEATHAYKSALNSYEMDVQLGQVTVDDKPSPPVLVTYTSLRPDVSTRWGSTVTMLERASRMKDAVDFVSTEIAGAPAKLTASEWDEVHDAVEVLLTINNSCIMSQTSDMSSSLSLLTMVAIVDDLAELKINNEDIPRIQQLCDIATQAAYKQVAYMYKEDACLFALLIDTTVTKDDLVYVQGVVADANNSLGVRHLATAAEVHHDMWRRLADVLEPKLLDVLSTLPSHTAASSSGASNTLPQESRDPTYFSPSMSAAGGPSKVVMAEPASSPQARSRMDAEREARARNIAKREKNAGKRLRAKSVDEVRGCKVRKMTVNDTPASVASFSNYKLVEVFCKVLTATLYNSRLISTSSSLSVGDMLAKFEDVCVGLESRKNWNRKADVRRIQVLCARFRLWGQGILLPSASAASVERLNSVATDMMTRKRNRLSALRAEKMMLLRAWMLFDFELTKKL
ncbi:uncharacterized protein AMSG_11937 [Thecamonas trahens ATCC 50062]|uniref:DUF659 domain-containing protein n=1 Tax=Thecamonas trahens ATCC 50062 TaxID=461836 RepID=A0A0L0DCJ9_THETB|nr:hypothetical protein AMSG_11937 [Thecamonas trahens ATCC 50062]KNC49826.1 hypothetical protein AMSG_11937 [Thecamonas trahens ATCC 50062]|eukprot:XP_013757437.1 hypothetical protein AMSG_11937 [Thecamonas trahens ATCC 50062]